MAKIKALKDTKETYSSLFNWNYRLDLCLIVPGKIFFMTDRKLKVYPKYRSLARARSARIVPELRLCGQWLERSGFRIGEQVQVTIKDQEIIIKPIQ